MLVTLMLFAISAHAAPILEAVRNPGFVPNPAQRTFTLSDDGALKVVSKTFGDKGTTKTTVLGTLTKAGLASVLKSVERISPEAKLVDPEPNAPQCSDAPTDETAVYIKGTRKVIHRTGGCHTWSLEQDQGEDLLGLAESLLN